MAHAITVFSAFKFDPVTDAAGKVVGSVSAGAGKQILSTWLYATAATAATTCIVVMNRPHMQGRIT